MTRYKLVLLVGIDTNASACELANLAIQYGYLSGHINDEKFQQTGHFFAFGTYPARPQEIDWITLKTRTYDFVTLTSYSPTKYYLGQNFSAKYFLFRQAA